MIGHQDGKAQILGGSPGPHRPIQIRARRLHDCGGIRTEALLSPLLDHGPHIARLTLNEDGRCLIMWVVLLESQVLIDTPT